MSKLQGKTAIVTGASKGIGAGIAAFNRGQCIRTSDGWTARPAVRIGQGVVCRLMPTVIPLLFSICWTSSYRNWIDHWFPPSGNATSPTDSNGVATLRLAVSGTTEPGSSVVMRPLLRWLGSIQPRRQRAFPEVGGLPCLRSAPGLPRSGVSASGRVSTSWRRAE
jgi:hypothetical protein